MCARLHSCLAMFSQIPKRRHDLQPEGGEAGDVRILLVVTFRETRMHSEAWCNNMCLNSGFVLCCMFNAWSCLSMCESICFDLSCLGSSCCCIMKIVYSPRWDDKGRALEQQMVYIVKEYLKHERQLLRERRKCIKMLQEKRNEKGLIG